MSKPYPKSMREIQDATQARVDADRARLPPMGPLPPQSPQWGDELGGLHEVQERMTSGSLSDAPDDGGPRPLGEQGSMPFSNMRSGR
jgi:hypothetical protein